jgi:hypothetical protein
MVGTIAPLVQEVAERGQRIRAQRILAAHVLSTAAGALTVGIAVWALRLALQAVVPQLARQLVALGPVLLALAALYLLAAVLTGSLRLPMLDRQVPQEWRVRIGPERASLAYGFVLGTGVLTRINSPAFYLLPLALLVTPSPALGLVLAALFGLARGGIVAVRSVTLGAVQRSDPEQVAIRGLRQRRSLVTLQLILLTAVAVVGVSIGAWQPSLL